MNIFQEALNAAVKKDMRSNPDNVQEPVLAVELVYRQTVYGYAGTEKSPFLRITVALQKLVAPSKRLLETENLYPALYHEYRAFESNIDFDIRFG